MSQPKKNGKLIMVFEDSPENRVETGNEQKPFASKRDRMTSGVSTKKNTIEHNDSDTDSDTPMPPNNKKKRSEPLVRSGAKKENMETVSPAAKPKRAALKDLSKNTRGAKNEHVKKAVCTMSPASKPKGLSKNTSGAVVEKTISTVSPAGKPKRVAFMELSKNKSLDSRSGLSTARHVAGPTDTKIRNVARNVKSVNAKKGEGSIPYDSFRAYYGLDFS